MIDKKSILNGNEHETICNQLDVKWVKSVVLIGSRAKGTAKKNSDYDIYVVVSALSVPFIYKKIKEKEKILEDVLGAKVSIAPLTLNRIRKRNDLLLFKTKKEGMTICGKDYLPFIKIDRVEDIPSDELFSYLFSSVYFLAERFDPENIQKMEDKEFIYNVAKSIMYCVETQLLMQGIYETEQEEVVQRARGELGLNNDLLDDIELAHSIITGDYLCIEVPINFWFSARDYILLVFQQLAEMFLGVKNELIVDAIESFKNGKCSFIKNLQYSILAGINNKKNPISHFFTKKSVEKYLCSSIMYLILSIEKGLSINNEFLNYSHQTLNLIGVSSNISEDITKKRQWNEVKHRIQEYWSMAHGKSVI